MLINFLAALICGTLNATKGSGVSKQGILEQYLIFPKQLMLIYIAVVFYLADPTKNTLHAFILYLGLLAQSIIGTGGLMQAFTDNIIDSKEFSPFDFLIVEIFFKEDDVDSFAEARKWGVIYGNLTGFFCFFIPSLVIVGLSNVLFILPLIGLGFYCGALRHLPNSIKIKNKEYIISKWRFIEFSYIFLYSFINLQLS